MFNLLNKYYSSSKGVGGERSMLAGLSRGRKDVMAMVAMRCVLIREWS